MREISDYRAGCRVVLGDQGGRRYDDNTLDMGFREALPVYRSFCPRRVTITQSVKGVEGCSLLLPPLEPGTEVQTVRIVDGPWLSFGVYQDDRSLYLNVYAYEQMPVVGTQLQLTLSVPHFIKGLDDAQQTTVPNTHSLTLIKGAAGYAMRIRARSVTEVFGKRPEDRAALMDQADGMEREFRGLLKEIALRVSYRQYPWGK